MGPYHRQSQTLEVNNSFCIFNEALQPITERFPDDVNQIPDFIIYIGKNDEKKSRICFKRVPAFAILDQEGEQDDWNMCQIVMKEDTAKDALNDEEFPGIINLRLKLY